jgi:hypothetical protein
MCISRECFRGRNTLLLFQNRVFNAEKEAMAAKFEADQLREQLKLERKEAQQKAFFAESSRKLAEAAVESERKLLSLKRSLEEGTKEAEKEMR